MNDIFIISLTNSDKICIIDYEDKDRVLSRKWYMTQKGCVRSTNKPQVGLHNFVSGFKMSDHKNRISLDNRKSNLRKANYIDNSRNRTKKKKGFITSNYKGVSRVCYREHWKAHIKLNGKSIHLGYFSNEIDAAKAYNKKALELFGEFANINII